jgi:amino acid transporter
MATPWKSIISLELPAAGAFEAAFKSPLLAKIVLFAGLCGIITTWNTIFISATRIIFALGRARIIPANFGKIHTVFRSPHIAIIFVGVIGAAGAFLGRSAILPLVNLGASGYSLAFLFTCLGVIRLRQTNPTQHRPYRLPGGIITAVFGVLSSLFCLFLSLYHPYINRSSAIPLEWIFILSWAILGMVFWSFSRKIRDQVKECDRRKLILGIYDS